MVITWFGLSCFRITSGNLTVVTDPFSKEVGLTPPRVQADIVIISNPTNPTYNNYSSLAGENRFVIDGPGEFDVRGLFVHGLADKTATIYSIRMEEIRLGFLGSLKQKELAETQLEGLGEIDILFIPTGGKTVLDAEEAVRIVNQIEPHVVLPMHFAQKGLKMALDKVEHFLKEIGSKAQPQEKLTIKRSEVAVLESQVVLLEPQR